MTLVLEGPYLFDGATISEDASVLVKNGKVVAIGRRGQFRSRAGKVLEAEFVMPGLIDMHAHVSGYSEDFLDAPFKASINFLNLLLYNGVTTVRDVGNYLETIFFLRKWGQRNAAPTIFSSGPILDELPLRWPFSRAIDSPTEARAEVGKLHAEGVDLIGEVYANVKRENLRAIIDEAHRRKLRVAGHLESVGAVEASEMGIDTLEHIMCLIDGSYVKRKIRVEGTDLGARFKKIFRIWELVDLRFEKVTQLLETLARKGTYVCPTLLVERRMVYPKEGFKDPNLKYMELVMPYHKYFRNPFFRMVFSRSMRKYDPFRAWSKEDWQRARAAFQKMSQLVKMLSDRHVKIIAGTDAPNPFIVPGFSLHQELELLVEAGLSPLQALRSATSVAAEALGKDKFGVICPNAQANLLLVNGNPTKDISDTNRIEYVVVKGVPFKRDELAKNIRP